MKPLIVAPRDGKELTVDPRFWSTSSSYERLMAEYGLYSDARNVKVNGKEIVVSECG